MLASPGDSVSLPSFSPDGSHIAFLVANSANWHDRFVYIFDLKSGEIRKRPQPLFHPSRPSWAADNKHLALSALEPSSGRDRKGWSEVLLLDVADFSGRFLEPVPGRSLGVRAANGPEWSPDGTRLAFVSDGTLWMLPVSNAGDAVGPALRLTNELADSISWTQDSKHMVYLSNGQLRRLDVQDGSIASIPLDPSWQPPHPQGRTVIHAGRLFDNNCFCREPWRTRNPIPSSFSQCNSSVESLRRNTAPRPTGRLDDLGRNKFNVRLWRRIFLMPIRVDFGNREKLRSPNAFGPRHERSLRRVVESERITTMTAGDEDCRDDALLGDLCCEPTHSRRHTTIV